MWRTPGVILYLLLSIIMINYKYQEIEVFMVRFTLTSMTMFSAMVMSHGIAMLGRA